MYVVFHKLEAAVGILDTPVVTVYRSLPWGCRDVVLDTPVVTICVDLYLGAVGMWFLIHL